MNQLSIKSLTIVLSIIFLASCGGGKKEEEFKTFNISAVPITVSFTSGSSKPESPFSINSNTS